MKKKLIIGLLPVLMALSACGGANPVENKAEFLEDALAHEELFGEVAPAFEKKAVRNDITPISTEPMVAIQYKQYQLKEVDYMAVRFVAAVKLATPETTVNWNRYLYTGEGAFSSTSTVPSVNRYTSIHDGGTPLTIAQFNTAHGTDFNYFVTYTMRKIPVNHANKYEDYYLNTTLVIGGESTNKVVSTTIDQSKQVSFASSYTGYFLKGTINSAANVYVPADGAKPDGSKARFLASLKANDSFYIINNNPEVSFFIYGSSYIEDTTHFGDDNGKIKAKTTNNLALLFKGSNQLIAKEQGYYVTYTNRSTDLSTSVPMSVDGTYGGQPQRTATISPKTGTALSFDLDYLPLDVYGEADANISNDTNLIITNGGENIGIWLKDVGNYQYMVWVNYPPFSVKINGDTSSVESRAEVGGNKAIYDLDLTAGQSVSIYCGDRALPVNGTEATSYIAPNSTNYVFYVNSSYEVWVDEYFDVSFTADISTPKGWGGVTDYSLYIWNATYGTPLGSWDDCLGNMTVNNNDASINANLKVGNWKAKIFFKQGSATKESNEMSFTVSSSKSYTINLGDFSPSDWSGNTFNGASIS